LAYDNEKEMRLAAIRWLPRSNEHWPASPEILSQTLLSDRHTDCFSTH